MEQRGGPGAMHDFDFLLGAWAIHNRRRPHALYRGQEGDWEEFEAHHIGVAYLDGRVIIEQYEGTFPSGERRLGLTIRTFDPQTHEWSIRWLDNRQPADFRPLIGRFEAGVGRFYQVIEAPDGQPLHVRYQWDEITEQTAHWQQAFSFDGGAHWEVNWVMELTRAQ